MKITPHQRQILAYARNNGGQITKKEAVAAFGFWHYCNAEKHIGDTLSRMVRARLLNRVKPGVFVLGIGTKTNPATLPSNDPTLF